MNIGFERPDQPDVARLIDELDAYQKPLYPPESHHGIDMDALLQPNVLFAVARDDIDGHALGCGAVVMGPVYGELKRMYVSMACRGQGLGHRLLHFLEAAAVGRGRMSLTLETGIHQDAALALYERAGYRRTAPFGDYGEDPLSVFMRKDFVFGAEAVPATSIVTYRIATADDALCLGVLATQVFLDTYATDGIRTSLALEARICLSTEATAAALAADGTTFIVAERAGHLIGFVHVALDSSHPQVETLRPAEVSRLYVLERFARTGIGTALLAHAEAYAAASGATTLWLTAWVRNTRALAFYVRRGYRESGSTPYIFEEEVFENRLFVKELGGVVPAQAGTQWRDAITTFGVSRTTKVKRPWRVTPTQSSTIRHAPRIVSCRCDRRAAYWRVLRRPVSCGIERESPTR